MVSAGPLALLLHPSAVLASPFCNIWPTIHSGPAHDHELHFFNHRPWTHVILTSTNVFTAYAVIEYCNVLKLMGHYL